MNIALNELLPLVGRLDSSPGFDTPRERFRRFLLEHVTDVQVASSLINECQPVVGEQRHRALQDLIVLVGRFLGFETVFGAYESTASSARIDGRWRSRGLLDVVLDIRTDQTADLTVDSLVRAMAAASTAPQGDTGPRIGLIVATRHYTGRSRLERVLAADPQHPVMRLVSVRSLLALAGLVAARRVKHLEVVRLLRSSFELDLVIDLLDRRLAEDSSGETTAAAPPVLASPREPAFWVATILDGDLAAADLLSTVVAQRHLLGISQAGALQNQGSPGDWVCFFLPGKGVAGHAQLASVVDAEAPVIRNADRYSRVYRLAHVELYHEPVAQAVRVGRPFAVPPADVLLPGPCLAPIARADFLALTKDWRGGAPGAGLPGSAAGARDLVSERRSRSHA